MQVNEKTPKTELVIDGHTFTVPAPFAKGHTCSEGDAHTLNQTLRENVRNNFAKRVKKTAEEAKEKKQDPAKAVAKLQADLDKYVTEYEFGIGAGGYRTTDPVRRKAIELAKGPIKKALIEQKGFKASEIPATLLTEKAVEAIDSGKYPKFMEQAEALVKAEKAAAAATSVDLDLGAAA